jgi:hypothetical protein
MLRIAFSPERGRVETVSDRLVAVALSYGLLVIVAYRAFALGEQSWDLMALLVASGVLGAGYQVWAGTPRRGFASLVVASTLIAAAAGSVIVLALAAR